MRLGSEQINRQIIFHEISNFRDLGGYPTVDERRVKRGLIFRSGGPLVLPTPEDRMIFERLNLQTVMDLRSDGESRMQPDLLPNNVELMRISAIYYKDGTELDFSPAGQDRMEEERADYHGDKEAFFTSLYTKMPFHNSAFQALFQLLEAGRVPLVFHCTSGKDRTGVAAMLILLALGVSTETTLEDYMLTNRCNQVEMRRWLAENEVFLAAHPEERDSIIDRISVHRRFAERTLNSILAQYGCYDAFFETEYGLTQNRLERIRDKYLDNQR